jgi:hypothetical protein
MCRSEDGQRQEQQRQPDSRQQRSQRDYQPQQQQQPDSRQQRSQSDYKPRQPPHREQEQEQQQQRPGRRPQRGQQDQQSRQQLPPRSRQPQQGKPDYHSLQPSRQQREQQQQQQQPSYLNSVPIVRPGGSKHDDDFHASSSWRDVGATADISVALRALGFPKPSHIQVLHGACLVLRHVAC